MSTAHRNPEQIIEHFDEPDVLEAKARTFALWLSESNHFTAFTGAGISTSAGIRDYRGPEGAWTLKAQGRKPTKKSVSSLKAVPTPTHMSLVELQNRGVLKYLISQNTDGLHRKSGILPENISELHGNSNRELCSKCGTEYMRDFTAVASYLYSVHDHRTGRRCVVKGCGGDLLDSIINFNENLPVLPLEKAWSNTANSDLQLVLGSSLTVTPACHMPKDIGKRDDARLVICNLQSTPYDKIASLVVHARCDEFMSLVFQILNEDYPMGSPLEIPSFKLSRRVVIETKKDLNQVQVFAVDTNGKPASIFCGVDMFGELQEEEPFIFDLKEQTTDLILHPMGNYNEPVFDLVIDIPNESYSQLVYDAVYDPNTGVWDIAVVELDHIIEVLDYELDIGIKRFDIEAPNGVAPRDTSMWHAVEPSYDCPHVGNHVKISPALNIGEAFSNNNHCKECGDESENWYCLQCGDVLCSRYVNSHGMKHYESTRHCILVSFTDLSFWCYGCQDYILDENLNIAKFTLHRAKFSEEHPEEH